MGPANTTMDPRACEMAWKQIQEGSTSLGSPAMDMFSGNAQSYRRGGVKKSPKSSELGKIPFTSNLKGNQIDGYGLEPFLLSVSFEGCKKVEKFNIMEANLVHKVISQAYVMWLPYCLFARMKHLDGWYTKDAVFRYNLDSAKI